MIKINLASDSKNVTLESYLRLVKLKPIALGFLLTFLPDMINSYYFQDQITIAQTDLSELQRQRNSLRAEMNKYKNIKSQIEKLKEREQNLQERLKVVKQIVETKKNPWNPILYISKNIPPSAWLTKMVYKPEPGVGVMDIAGYSTDYKVQREFVDALKQSIFFDKFIEPKKVTEETANNDQAKGFAPFEFNLVLVRLE